MRVVLLGSLGTLLVMIGLLAAPAPARAEGDAVCRQYATDAVNAFQQSQSLGCGFSNARWQGNYDAHYGWCRNAPSEWLQSEARGRENQLRVCRGEAKAVECHKYAILSVSDQQSNLSGGCGFTGARWQDSYDNHLGWCLGAPMDQVNRELAIRHAMLGICGRQEPFVRCDAYARQAVAQGQEAASRNCGGIEGPRWTASYEDHLTWCIGQPPEAAASEAAQRDGLLSQCRTNSPASGGGTTPAGESCSWSARVVNLSCLNADGSVASIPPGSLSVVACGGTQDSALARARASFASAACLTDGDDPAPGCCTYQQEVVQGCQCQ